MATVHLYSDGSALTAPNSAGGGIVLHHGDTCLYAAFSFDDTTDCNVAECKAILKGLEEVVAITAFDGIKREHIITKVMIYTDSQAALQLLNRQQEGEQKITAPMTRVADQIFKAMIILDARGIGSQVDWIEGHSGIRENEHADLLARYGADKGRIAGNWNKRFEIDRDEFNAMWTEDGGRHREQHWARVKEREAKDREDRRRWAVRMSSAELAAREREYVR